MGADLFRGGLLDGANEATDLIAHRLGSNASGSGFEVDMAGAPYAGAEGVAARNEGLRHVAVFFSCSELVRWRR
jgi:hypothetical protein